MARERALLGVQKDDGVEYLRVGELGPRSDPDVGARYWSAPRERLDALFAIGHLRRLDPYSLATPRDGQWPEPGGPERAHNEQAFLQAARREGAEWAALIDGQHGRVWLIAPEESRAVIEDAIEAMRAAGEAITGMLSRFEASARMRRQAAVQAREAGRDEALRAAGLLARGVAPGRLALSEWAFGVSNKFVRSYADRAGSRSRKLTAAVEDAERVQGQIAEAEEGARALLERVTIAEGGAPLWEWTA